MGMRVKTSGDFENTELFLEHAKDFDIMPVLEQYGEIGVKRLFDATPKRTGLTAASWYYEIEKTRDGYVINWCNSNIQGGENIALLIQYGHGTRTGAWVQGRDYINPAIEPVLDDLRKAISEEVLNDGKHDR